MSTARMSKRDREAAQVEADIAKFSVDFLGSMKWLLERRDELAARRAEFGGLPYQIEPIAMAIDESLQLFALRNANLFRRIERTEALLAADPRVTK